MNRTKQLACSLLGFLGILGALVAAALIARVDADSAESVEGTNLGLGLVVGNLDNLDLGSGVSEGHDGAGDLVGSGSGLEGLGGGVVDLALLGFVFLAGEKNHLALVLLEAVHVKIVLFLAGAGSAVVNGDTNSAGKGSREASRLELSKGETTAKTNLTGIAASAGRDNGTEGLDGTGEHLSGLLVTLHAARNFLAGLIEVSLDALDPVLAEMDFRDIVVVLDHC